MECEEGTHLYRRLARRIEVAIRKGAVCPGDRLPSVRQCAQVHRVSLSTVLLAYKILEDAQLIEARPKAGHFVAATRPSLPEPEVSSPPSSALIVDITSLIDTVMSSARSSQLVSFGPGYPSADAALIEQVQKAAQRAVQRSGPALGLYPQVPGDETLRKAVARRALGMGCVIDPRDVLITSGTTESISLCLQTLLRPGDTVALESPTSFGFLRLLQALGLRALEIPTHPRHGLSVDALAMAVQTQSVRAVLATPTLSNPLGTSMPVHERERLAALLNRHKVPLIEDVVYNDLASDDELRRAVRSFDVHGWVFLCGSYSKTVAPGLRVGWLNAPQGWGAPIRQLKTALSGAQSLISELALAELLAESTYARQLRRLRELNARQLGEARRMVSEFFPAGTRVTDPAGGSLIWVELPPELDALELFRACLDEGIMIAPGTMFSASESYRHCMRLCIPRSWSDAHRRALRRIGELAATMLAGRPAADAAVRRRSGMETAASAGALR